MKKTASLTLIIFIIFSAFSSCALRNEAPFILYTNEDYHFTFRHPSSFSSVTVTETDDSGDESTIVFRNPDTDGVITIYCVFNPSSDFYSFVREHDLVLSKITSLNPNSFVYDDREGREPAYYIISATKRMIICVEYKFDKNDAEAYELCEMLEFNFTLYANTPRQNAFLSDRIYISGGRFSFQLPADVSYELLPRVDAPLTEEVAVQTDGEDTSDPVPDTSGYNRVIAENKAYFVSMKAVTFDEGHYTRETLTEDTARAVDYETISSASDGQLSQISEIEYACIGEENGEIYIIKYFKCRYNSRESSGAYIAGYSRTGLFYEYVYACADSAEDGEREQYTAMLSSAEFH